MGKYDEKKMPHRGEDYNNTRKIKTHNILCDIASGISELKEAIDRFSEKFKRPETLMDKYKRRDNDGH